MKNSQLQINNYPLNYRKCIVQKSIFIKILVMYMPIEIVYIIMDEFFKCIPSLKDSFRLVNIFFPKNKSIEIIDDETTELKIQ
jgi:hypothetical protein